MNTESVESSYYGRGIKMDRKTEIKKKGRKEMHTATAYFRTM